MSIYPSVCGGYGIRGDKGDKGDPGQGIFFQGPWDPDETYTAGDMVTTDDGIFVASEAVPAGTAPPDAPWSLVVLWDEITGPPGPSGTAYTHTQTTASSSWTVTHSLGYYPAVSVISADGHVVYADTQHISTAVAVITFPSPTTGTASCS